MENKNSTDFNAIKHLHELKVYQVELEMQNHELKLARETAEKAITNYTSLYAHAPSGYFTLEKDSKISMLNLTGAILLGNTRSQLLNCRLQSFISQDSLSIFNNFMTDVFEKDVKVSCEVMIKSVEHLFLWVQIDGRVTEDEKNCSCVMFDITNRKNAEQKNEALTMELSRRIKELESFSYSVSHDLRAPLRGIDGFIAIFLKKYYEEVDEQGKRLLNKIRNKVDKMAHLIDDLLSLSRVGLKEIKVKQFNMNELVKEAMEEVGEKMENIKLTIMDLGKAHGDSVLITQVWINLISNAFKYSKNTQNPKIEIGRFEKANFINYYIKDNGVGFNMEYSNKLFETFHQLHKSGEFEGAGVGLAIVKSIVNKHGGSVWAEGIENQGATFNFSLPIKTLNEKN